MVKKGVKYFINYKYGDKIKLLCRELPKTNEYVKYFDENKCMNSVIKDEELLEVHDKIWEKISNLMKKEFEL